MKQKRYFYILTLETIGINKILKITESGQYSENVEQSNQKRYDDVLDKICIKHNLPKEKSSVLFYNMVEEKWI